MKLMQELSDYQKLKADEARYKKMLSYKKWYYNKPGAREHRKETKRIWYSVPKNRISCLLKEAANRCRNNGMEVDKEYLLSLKDNTYTHCKCCGVEYDYTAKRSNTPSVDRVDNSKGYIKGNVEIICANCNITKNDLTIEKMNMFISYISSVTGKPANMENPQAPIRLW